MILHVTLLGVFAPFATSVVLWYFFLSPGSWWQRRSVRQPLLNFHCSHEQAWTVAYAREWCSKCGALSSRREDGGILWEIPDVSVPGVPPDDNIDCEYDP